MGHTYSRILLHVIFSTAGRRNLIAEDYRKRLYEYMAGIARSEFGRALCIGGTANHIHGLLSLNPVHSASEAMRKWKCLSSRWLHETFPAMEGFAWQEGYGAFSVSESNVEQVRRYIENQATHHHTLSFEDEFIGFLTRHGIDYDPQKILD
jgi:REP element-mobilizing transposase RayT